MIDFSDEGLRELFSYHPPPHYEVVRAHERVREACLAAARELAAAAPRCPELTLAVRALEVAMMQANAAIARNHSAIAEVASEG